MNKKLKIIFMGTPDFAVSALDAVIEAGHDVIAVYCQPPRPAGRGHKLQPSPVQKHAEALGIPVYCPLNLKKDAEARQVFAALGADVAVVAAYGLILPEEVLQAPKYGCINIHASLLPRWRGAAPIQRAILAGDTQSGVCIMQMDKGLDTGPVLLRGTTPITATTAAPELHDALAALGAELIVKALDNIDTLKPEPQPEEGATYAAMLTKDEGRVDWTKPAAEIECQIRALTPWPGVWSLQGAQRLRILEAAVTAGNGAPGEIIDRRLVIACGKDALLLKTVQPQDRKPMEGVSFMNGAHLNVGDKLT